jgi:hypothetical protein
MRDKRVIWSDDAKYIICLLNFLSCNIFLSGYNFDILKISKYEKIALWSLKLKQIHFEDPFKRLLVRNRVWSYTITSLIKNWKDHYLSNEIKQGVGEVRGCRLLQSEDQSSPKENLSSHYH